MLKFFFKSSPEPVGLYHPNLEQNELRRMEYKLFKSSCKPVLSGDNGDSDNILPPFKIYATNFNQPWHKVSLSKKDAKFYKW